MRTLELTEKELACLLRALGKLEAQLLSSDDPYMEDRATDLLFVQSLQQRLKAPMPGK